jgi:helix-turn-helix protein
MTDSRIAAATQAAAGPIEAAGASWMLHPEQFEASTQAGYPHPFAGYFAGRGGVLGDVDARTVDAVFGYFAPEVVTQMWTMGVPVHGAQGGAELYFSQCADWGRKHIAGVAGLDRFVTLAEKVVDSAPAFGLPLFAGWRSLPRAEDTTGRAFQLVLIMRELRGGIHSAAVTAAGLTPQEAHLLNKGAEYCAFFGWAEPYPSVEHLKAVREEVEEATNNRVAVIVAGVLSADEAEELAKLADAINAKASA